MTYPLKYREKVFVLKAKNNWTFQKTAEHFEICIRTLLRWSKRLEPILKHKTHKRKIDIERLPEDIDKYPDACQYERAKRLNVSQWCVGYNLKKLKISYKKNTQSPQA